MKRLLCCLCALFIALSLLSPPAVAEELNLSELYKTKDVDATWSAASATTVDLNALGGAAVLISAGGDYVLTGAWNGQIIVEAPEDQKVRLILNGVTIASPEGPAIYEKQADKLIVTLAEGTVNTLTDGAAIGDGDDTIGAALYAEDDLSINGSGALLLNGTQKHGIQSKADLIIAGGDITVTAQSDAVRGKNSVLVLDGSLRITSQGDGIVATREDREDKGWVVIAGGTIDITTGSGAGTPKQSANSQRGGMGRGWGQQTYYSTSAADTVSQKGVKAATTLTVVGGSLTLNCADDGLHAVNVTVAGGTFSILTGDDGMHADEEMVVTSGVIDIAQCYEGIEGKNVTIAGGDIRVVASDDGINAAGGNDGSGLDGGWGRGWGESATNNLLTISGGALQVTAGGDGLDSNGSILITGGVTGVYATTSTGEGAIDFNGTGVVEGGLLIIASTTGTMQDTASLTGSPLISIPLTGTQAASTLIQVYGADGALLGSFTPASSFDTLVLAGSGVAVGNTIQVYCGQQNVFSGAITSSMTSLSSGGYGGGFGTRMNRRGH